MAKTYVYNNSNISIEHIYRATSGGSVFSSNLASLSAFDYFEDTAVVNDAIYFAPGIRNSSMSDLRLNVGTALVADNIELVWEYYKIREDLSGYDWVEIEGLSDETNNFTVLGQNTVKFPPQWSPGLPVIQGQTLNFFVRCRITSVTNLTEGGANTTDLVTTSNGLLNISGSTEIDPFTFEDVYQWLLTNQPHIPITKRTHNSYDFTKIGLSVGSRLETKNEIIEFGQNSILNSGVARTDLNNVISGVKLGNRGYDGSVFIIHGIGNSSVCTLGTNSEIYGSTFKKGKTQQIINLTPGYFWLTGQMYDSLFEISANTGLFGASDNLVNCSIRGNTWIYSAVGKDIVNLNYISNHNNLFFQVPRMTTNLIGFDYGFSAGAGYIFWLYAYCYRYEDINTNLINPVIPLGSISDAIKPAYRSVTNPNAISTVKWYDAGSGTYTDYTTEASNDTENNLPLHGEVGDILYLKITNLYYSNFYLERNDTVNDYEYEWEYFSGGNWVTLAPFYKDGTNGIAKTGNILSCVASPNAIQSTTVDSESGNWIRLKIITKGTGSPMANKLMERRIYGEGDWKINELYSVDLTIIDEDGNPIENAIITGTDENNDEIFSETTDANGQIIQQTVLKKQFKTDPDPDLQSDYFIKEIVYNIYSLEIKADGYETYTAKLDIKQLNTTITLKKLSNIIYDVEGENYKRLDITNPDSKIIHL